MTNLQNRTRVVYVRVSESEFRQFRELCQQQGARNMSDLVRSAMENMSRQRGSDFERDVTQKLQQLENSLDHLKSKMAEIAPERKA